MRQTHQQFSNEFPTKDIYLATVIKQAGVPIIRVEGNGSRGVFVFQTSKKIEGLIRDYFNGQLRVDPRTLFDTWKALKSMAFSSTGNLR